MSFATRVCLVALLFAAACAGEDSAGVPVAVGGGPGSGGSGGGGAGAGGVGGTCADSPPVETSALSFDGIDDQVSMGVAPALGLSEFTVEAWVRRDGRGLEAGTGVGGLRLVPIAGKGRGEGDGSDVDCNYAFGFFGDVLGADFEDMATGANHPVVGTTAVPVGSWHHVAASYDGTTWRLYVDGVLDAETVVNATPRHDSIQHFGIGTTFDSVGDPAGALHGGVDELRVWDHARTAEQIASGMYRTLTAGPGLVARWGLDLEDGGAVDSLGQLDGMVSGATFVEPGAVLDLGAPPVVTVLGPDDGAVVDAASVELAVGLDDADGDEAVVTFHVREISEADDFTIVVMPDTQKYTIEGNNLEYYFEDQTAWIMDNREAYNIAGVIHNGDLVEHGNNVHEFGVADGAMSTLEEPYTGALDGIPYGIGVGNHDQSPNGTTNNTALFNEWFGVDRFVGRAYYGGHYGGDNDESWFTFNAGGLDFVVVNLQYAPDPSPAVLDWARSIFASHPAAFGILNSHYIVKSNGNFGPQGQAIYDALADVDNVHLMTCGHISAEARRTDELDGHIIHSMLADYQSRPDGGAGFLRIWEFSPANDELTVRSYSPTLDEFEIDEDSEYTLSVPLSRVGGLFDALANLEGVQTEGDAEAAATLDLAPASTYEWYASVTDCAHTVTTPVRTITTP